MKKPFTRAHSTYFVPRVWAVWGIVASFTAGCVRELTDLTFEARPEPDASLVDAANLVDASVQTSVPDAALRDAATSDVVVVSAPKREAGISPDSTQPTPEAGIVTVKPALEDASTTSGNPPNSGVFDAGSYVVDAAADAATLGEHWPFEIALALSPGDAGAGTVELFPASGLVVDGSSLDWSEQGWLWIATPDPTIGEPPSERDLSAVLSVRWDQVRLYLVVVVRDERQINDASGFDIWGGDSIQVAFDVGQGRSPYDWEYGFAATTHGLVAHRWREGDADLTHDMEFAVARHTALTVYEVAFEARHLGIDAFPTNTLRLSVAVNDNDGQERSAAIELVQGIVGTKSAQHFASANWEP